ncbi:MAG: M48 family metallopeptidase [Alphaproteobacteria bacterium]|nr:M48 family metallopeptidase [Alphaproteobacteria bacterium]MCB1550470.1 M48 family metallopeptidase [Alphaproteobacteria bacterium]MCB9985965.1 M48 family metallopeptidase [Micavibrio sp.]HPQ50406.1 M48 family metalloprotease [Alphaproteobacteria bacterium]HRK96880.1 M48 family metalloprotease [Alphaproteobacteria bacterium]
MKLQFRPFVSATLCAAMVLACPLNVQAQQSGQTIIRDAEIEQSIREWTADVIRAAGMNPEQIKIILVQSPDVNAFVAGGANIFIYTGLIQKTDNAGEVIGVIAHELGHIAGGHLTRTGEVARNASFETIMGALIGLGAAVATGDGSAAAAGIRIGQGQAMNKYLAYSRVQESSADQAGFRFLSGAGMSPEGLTSFLEKLSSQELLTTSQQSQYVRTHPMSSDRVEALENKLKNSPQQSVKLPEDWDRQYGLMKAKLLGFITPQQVTYAYKKEDTSLPASYARAIAAYKFNHVQESLDLADSLIKREPQNPYFLELKGQMLFDFGKAAQAVPYYEKSVKYAPESGLIRMAYAQALIESSGKDPLRLKDAIGQLKRAERDEPRVSKIKRLLATAFGKMGKEPEARIYLAEEALMQGNKSEALRIAKVTKEHLVPNSPEALRAADIINTVGDSEEKR